MTVPTMGVVMSSLAVAVSTKLLKTLTLQGGIGKLVFQAVSLTANHTDPSKRKRKPWQMLTRWS